MILSSLNSKLKNLCPESERSESYPLLSFEEKISGEILLNYGYKRKLTPHKYFSVSQSEMQTIFLLSFLLFKVLLCLSANGRVGYAV
jgi:hypothetical protein